MMDFVTHLPRTHRRHDTVWVIVDRLTKSAHFLAMRMTFTLEEFFHLYIHDIIRVHGVPVSIVSNRDPRFTSLLEEFPKSHEDTIDDEHNISSLDRWLVGEDHTDFRGHSTCM